MGDLPCRQIKPNTAVNNLFSHHGGSQQGRKRGTQAAVGQDSGLKPNLPVQATVKYETVLKLPDREARGLQIPPTLLVCADELIASRLSPKSGLGHPNHACTRAARHYPPQLRKNAPLNVQRQACACWTAESTQWPPRVRRKVHSSVASCGLVLPSTMRPLARSNVRSTIE